MKALLIILLPVLYLKGNLSITSTPPLESAKSVLCYECLQSGSYKCEKTKLCNITMGYCQIIIFEGKDDQKTVRQSCAASCEFSTMLFIEAKMYHALCCSFNFCNQFHYSMEVSLHYPDIAAFSLTANVFWTHFWVLLQCIGLED